MSKKLLVDQIAGDFDSRAQAERAVDRVFEGLNAVVRGGARVSIKDLGSFKVKHRAERMGRNPRSGEPVKIQARDVLVFTASK
jgi:nucleoid DNA-binding protein